MEEFQLWEVVKGDLGGLSEKKSIMHSFLSFQYFLMHNIVMYLVQPKGLCRCSTLVGQVSVSV